MKAILFILTLFLPISIWAQTKPYTLDGEITGLKTPAKVYMRYQQDDHFVMDSAAVINGKFRFSGTNHDPELVYLILNHTDQGYHQSDKNRDVLVMYTEPVSIRVHATDSIKYATVTGSKINADFKIYNNYLAKTKKANDELNSIYMRATPDQRKDTSFINPLRRKAEAVAQTEKGIIMTYIQKNPDSYFSLANLSRYADTMPADSVKQLFKQLSPRLRNSELGNSLIAQLQAANATVIGANAPDFTQTDVNGKSITLSGFKGKYVLIDFWASWCGPCRAENPNVVKAYNTYKDQNFTIIGVSLDKDKAAWTNAIEKDGLTWTEVSDLKFWNNAAAKLYGIRAIPQNFLIDPQGKIIAVNLREDALDKKLAEILNKTH